MKGKRKWGAEGYLALAVLGFLTTMCLLNARLAFTPLKRLLTLEIDFASFTEEIQFTYTNNTAWKIPFVNLNGLFARATGQRLCNEVIRLNNGMLCDQQPYSLNFYPAGAELLRFREYLEQKDIPFLYVQAPYKVDLESELLPEGVVNLSNDDASQFLEALAQYGVNVMDLRPSFSQNAQMVSENFFRTDHHWTFTAALRAFPLLLERMEQLLPGQELDMSCAGSDRWEAHTLEQWYLGTWGRRTGVFFGGLDDFTYYTPRFQTQISRSLPLTQTLYAGDFVQANMKTEYIRHRDFFGSSPYNVYGDGNHPLSELRNADAPNKLKVLLIEDSFGLPVECFFSTVFSEVNVMDPRMIHPPMDNVMEYVNNTHPDIVLMMITTTGFNEPSYSDFGVGYEWTRENAMSGAQTQVFRGDVSVEGSAQKDGQDCLALPVTLEAGKRYTLRCDSILLEDGSAPAAGAAAVVCTPEEEGFIKSQVFHLDYGNRNGGFTWSFNVPADQTGPLQLLLYAGLPQESDGVKLTYVNASLTLEE